MSDITTNKRLCSGFFVAGDEGNAEAQSLFMCERKTFNDLCNGLTQPCQCQANAWRMIKIVQVCLAASDEVTEHSLVHACTVERTCPSCRVSVSAV